MHCHPLSTDALHEKGLRRNTDADNNRQVIRQGSAWGHLVPENRRQDCTQAKHPCLYPSYHCAWSPGPGRLTRYRTAIGFMVGILVKRP